jgi:hypothetical protein
MEILKTMPDYSLIWLHAGEQIQVRDPHVSCILGPVDISDDLVIFQRNSLALLEMVSATNTIVRVIWSYHLEECPLLRNLRFWNQQHPADVPRHRPWGVKKSTAAFVAQYIERHDVAFAKFRKQHFAVTPKDWVVVPTTRMIGKSSYIVLSPDQLDHFKQEYKARKKLGYVYPGSASLKKALAHSMILTASNPCTNCTGTGSCWHLAICSTR